MNASKPAIAIVAALLVCAGPAFPSERPAAPVPRAEGWLIQSFTALKKPTPPADTVADLDEVKRIVTKRTAADIERIHWWHAAGAVYRWNEIALRTLLDDFVTLPLAARHLALVQAAVDDAAAATRQDKGAATRLRPSVADPSIKAALPVPAGPSYPSESAAVAAAAAAMLANLFPSRAAALAALAEETMSMAVLAGIEYPSDVAAGRALGEQVAALAIARAKSDGANTKWGGSVPEGPGLWKGANPAAPAAAAWRTWVLASPDELRPPPPPAFDSEQIKRELAELKSYRRTPHSNHQAIYWEVFGGARAHALWNEIARAKLLEYGPAFDTAAAARALAALNIAFADATVACWDAKYAYWYIRPSQLDPELKPLFPPPGHPSYPAAHGCLSTAASTILAAVFPRDRDQLLALGRQAAEARIWAGIHYRTDIDVGQKLGRDVAEKVLTRAFVSLAR